MSLLCCKIYFSLPPPVEHPAFRVGGEGEALAGGDGGAEESTLR